MERRAGQLTIGAPATAAREPTQRTDSRRATPGSPPGPDLALQAGPRARGPALQRRPRGRPGQTSARRAAHRPPHGGRQHDRKGVARRHRPAIVCRLSAAGGALPRRGGHGYPVEYFHKTRSAAAADRRVGLNGVPSAEGAGRARSLARPGRGLGRLAHGSRGPRRHRGAADLPPRPSLHRPGAPRTRPRAPVDPSVSAGRESLDRDPTECFNALQPDRPVPV